MKKRELFLGGLLMLTMTFITVTFTACHDDDKKYEEVEDPLVKEKQYFIVGTVANGQGVLAGAKVDAGNSVSTTTDVNGVYMLTVKDTGKYTLTFTAKDMKEFTSDVTIADNADNRSQVMLNVKLAQAISFDKAKEETVKSDRETTVEVASTPAEGGAPVVTATVNVPKGAAEEGTRIAAVNYEEAKAVGTEKSGSAPKIEAATLSAVAIQVTPATTVAKAPIEIKSAVAGGTGSDFYFDPSAMEALKDRAVTKAAVPFGDVTFVNGEYVITIPKGEVIAGKYLTNLLPTKTVGSVKPGAYNRVNGKEGVVKIENRDFSALNTTLNVATTCGWEYVVSPETALKAVGAPDWMTGILNKSIRDAEGSKEGLYTVNKELKTSISGNYQLLFGSRIQTQEKSYTFSLFAQGKNVQVVVKLKSYVGYTEEYSNNPISQHSGGSTGK